MRYGYGVSKKSKTVRSIKGSLLKGEALMFNLQKQICFLYISTLKAKVHISRLHMRTNSVVSLFPKEPPVN